MRLFERIRSKRGFVVKGLMGLGLAAGLSVTLAAPASADPYWGHHGGYYRGGYHYSGYYRPFYPRPYIYAAPRVYYPPPPVYYAPPAPVYYPGPAYYPAPAYYAPRPFIGIGIGLPLVFRIH